MVPGFRGLQWPQVAAFGRFRVSAEETMEGQRTGENCQEPAGNVAIGWAKELAEAPGSRTQPPRASGERPILKTGRATGPRSLPLGHGPDETTRYPGLPAGLSLVLDEARRSLDRMTGSSEAGPGPTSRVPRHNSGRGLPTRWGWAASYDYSRGVHGTPPAGSPRSGTRRGRAGSTS